MATVPQTVPCPFCQGVGREHKGDECDACGGAGQIPVDMTHHRWQRELVVAIAGNATRQLC